MHLRRYDPDKDLAAVQQIWYETGWLKKDHLEAQEYFIASGDAFVSEIHGRAECLVLTSHGDIQYLDGRMPFSTVAAVSTSRVARRQGAAKRLTALATAEAAKDGALVMGLGMFEQGFYNQLGYGTGGYETILYFDPSSLRVPFRHRVPRRITHEAWEQVHLCRLNRIRGHASCSLSSPYVTRGELTRMADMFGLGYADGPNGEITHMIWVTVQDLSRGPYQIQWLIYRNREQFLELMALIASMGDQIRMVRMVEPPNIQVQDLLFEPFKYRVITDKGRFENTAQAVAFWQMRMLDLGGCLKNTHLPGEPLRFNLQLSDPIEALLDDDAPWRGVAGEYVVTLGPESAADTGSEPALPTLRASVGAFTRLWLGVRPATGLAATDDLRGPDDILLCLDRKLCLPPPRPDWDF